MARIPATGGARAGFVRQRVRVAASANGAALRAIAAAVPAAFNSRAAPSSASTAVVAPLPVGAVRPVDLGTVGSESACDELPAGRGHHVRSLEGAGRGIALFVGEIEEDAAVAGDGGLFVGIALRAPLAEEAGTLIPLRHRSSGCDLGIKQ